MNARIEEARAENEEGDGLASVEWLCRVAEAAERLCDSVGEHDLNNLADVHALVELRRRLDQRVYWDGRIGQWVVATEVEWKKVFE